MDDLLHYLSQHPQMPLDQLEVLFGPIDASRLADQAVIIGHTVYYLEAFLVAKVKGNQLFSREGHLKTIRPGQWLDQDEILCTPSGKIIGLIRHHFTRLHGQVIFRKGKPQFVTDQISRRRFKLDLGPFGKVIYHRAKVVVDITRYDDPLHIKLIHVQPKQATKTDEISATLIEAGYALSFDKRVLDQANHIQPAKVKRKDLRHLTTFTIDGQSAKDFDDAISVVDNDLYVHIADVSSFVQPHSLLDKEAKRRGNSLYVCDRVVPMMPEKLSNDLCSLNPGVDRYALTCQMKLNRLGRVIDYEVYPSLIRSDYRFTYEQINAGYQPIVELKKLKIISDKLKKRAIKRGWIEFDSQESNIRLDKQGKVLSVELAERGFAQEMIEMCMIQANECVANLLETKGIAAIYRVHTAPDEEKMTAFIQVAQSLGVNFKEGLGPTLDQIEDEALKQMVSRLALRSMQKAYYDPRCLGHYGLSLDQYCHFTSPIRRYADLIVHRALYMACFGQKPVKQNLNEIAYHISQTERLAIQTERKVNDQKKAEWMEQFIGHNFEGIISSITRFGFFVSLENGVDGLVALRNLDEYYEFDQASLQLFSDHHRFCLGQRVLVRCLKTDAQKGQIDFDYIKTL